MFNLKQPKGKLKDRYTVDIDLSYKLKFSTTADSCVLSNENDIDNTTITNSKSEFYATVPADSFFVIKLCTIYL